MKRRDLIKLGSAILGSASLGALTGYGACSAINGNNAEKNAVSNNELKVIPKQTAPYEFSSPMPFDKSLIDRIAKLNKKMTKGKIKVLYSSLPKNAGSPIHRIMESTRGNNPNVKNLDDYIEYIKYAQEKGFKCYYTLNTTTNIDSSEIDGIAKAIMPTFEKLHQAGINDIKLTHPVLLSLFSEKMPYFNIHLSTCTEYHSIQNYQYALDVFPTIKSINISTDDNYNFEFLTSLKKMLPDVKLEILVNEALCIKNCIARCSHFATEHTSFPCKTLMSKNPVLYLCRTNLVHPWLLDYYSAIGINTFKLTTTTVARNEIQSIYFLKYYLNCLEKGVKEYSANDIWDKIYIGFTTNPSTRFKKNYTLDKLIKYLPNMDYLVAHGPKCASECGVGCRYCYNCAEKMKELLA